MHAFTATIQKFSNKGEKTGWTYVDLPPDVLKRLKLKSAKEFRVKGFIDDVPISRLAVYPIGEGNYIIALKADLRKKLGKKEGAMVKVRIEVDEAEMPKSKELSACLADDPVAKAFFESLNKSHRNYYHMYALQAKTLATKATRVANILNAMHKKQKFGEMVRELKGKRAQ